MLVLAGLLVLPIELPWQAASMVFFLAALVYGVRALRACLTSGIGGGVGIAMGLGLVATCLLVLVELAVLVSWPTTVRTQRCLADALTVQARDACTAAQTAQLDDLLG